ncbi:MAG: patatin-like protein [Acidimicrobiales bacterium]
MQADPEQGFIPDAPSSRPEHKEELRLALAMRGGVSLAVWIGGAIAELDRLRRSADASTTDDPLRQSEVYRGLLELADYDGVAIDVLAGASAGGLNGAIYATSLVYGVDFNAMANLWLRIADIEWLLRNSTEPHPPSLMEGDDYFLAEFERELIDLLAKADEADAIDRLDLLLTTTLVHPTQSSFFDMAFKTIREPRSDGFFHFRHLGDELSSPLSDFAISEDDQARSKGAIAAKLGLAARASSSFPVAFEPAKIPGGQEFLGIFSRAEPNDSRTTSTIDGGVLDNIPVARAIRAIAAAPASGPTRRWLLYLHPSPAPAPEPSIADSNEDQPRANKLLATLWRTLRLKFDSESLIEDIAELNRHNAEALQRQQIRRTLAAPVTSAGGASALSDEAPELWAAIDATRIRQVLRDPQLAVVGHLVPIASSFDYSSWPPSTRSEFEQRLQSALRYHYSEPDRDLPLPALLDTVELLLGWAQLLGASAGPAKTILYRVRLLGEILSARWEQTWIEWAERRAGQQIDEQDLAATILLARDSSERCSDELCALLGSTETDAELHRKLASLAGADTDELAGSLAGVWAVLAEQAEVLRSLGTVDHPANTALSHADPATPNHLRELAVSMAPLHRRVLNGESAIRFLRVSGANQTPLSSWFATPPNTPETKLAGNQLVNFAAFFSARWRANDWMWGRLDAATSIVDLLADSTRWFAGRTGQQLDERRYEVLEVLRSLVDDAVWSQHRDSVSEEIGEAAGTPGVRHQLPAVKALLLHQVHGDLLARHLPWVANTDHGSMLRPPAIDHVAPAESVTQILAGEHCVGTETLASLDANRRARINMRVAMIAWKALKPGGVGGVLATLVKPLFLFAVAVVTQARRAVLAGVIGMGVLAIGRWEKPATSLFDGPLFLNGCDDCSSYFIWQRWLSIAGIVLLVLGALLIEYSSFKSFKAARTASPQISTQYWSTRLLPWAPTALLVVAIGITFTKSISVPTWTMLFAAATTILLGMQWMRFRNRAIALLLAMAPYLLFEWLGDSVAERFTGSQLSSGWWVILSFATAVALATAYVSWVDVFPRRPTPRSSVD